MTPSSSAHDLNPTPTHRKQRDERGTAFTISAILMTGPPAIRLFTGSHGTKARLYPGPGDAETVSHLATSPPGMWPRSISRL